MSEYDHFLQWWSRVSELWEIDFIAAHELVQPEKGIPPMELWPNILPTAWIVNSLRDYYGEPVRITSAYRSPQYNAEVGGSVQSRHIHFNALDFQFDNVSPEIVQDELRSDGTLKLGIGLGVYETFTHLDTRAFVFPWMSPQEWTG